MAQSADIIKNLKSIKSSDEWKSVKRISKGWSSDEKYFIETAEIPMKNFISWKASGSSRAYHTVLARLMPILITKFRRSFGLHRRFMLHMPRCFPSSGQKSSVGKKLME